MQNILAHTIAARHGLATFQAHGATLDDWRAFISDVLWLYGDTIGLLSVALGFGLLALFTREKRASIKRHSKRIKRCTVTVIR